jgi:hypothetical protein
MTTTTTTTTMTTPTTTPTYLLRFTSLAVFFFILQAATAQVQQFVMQQSDPVTIQVDVREYLFTVSPGAQGNPLGYVEVNVEDYFSRDYSGLAGSSDFTINFDPNIIDFGNSVPSSNPARISILELKENPVGAFHLVVDRGKTSLCFPLGYETGEEELSRLVRLVRTKDGRLAAMITFNDTEGILASVQPGISERICMVLPLQESDPAKSLKLVRDKEGNSFALLLLSDGNSRAKADGSGKANIGVTILTPSDKKMAEKMEMTLVVVN